MKGKTLLAVISAIVVSCIPASGENPERKPVIGSTRSEINDLLSGWTSQKDPFHPKTQVSYYSADAEIVVAFAAGRAIGVAVIARRRDQSFSFPRARELKALVTAGDPTKPTGMMPERGSVGFSFGPVAWSRHSGGSKPLPRKRAIAPTPTPEHRAEFVGEWRVSYPRQTIRTRDLKPDGTLTTDRDGEGRWFVSATHLELHFDGARWERFALPPKDGSMPGTESGAQALSATK